MSHSIFTKARRHYEAQAQQAQRTKDLRERDYQLLINAGIGAAEARAIADGAAR